MMNELLGHYPKSRAWLLRYLLTARFKNSLLQDALNADWSHYSKEKASYLLGSIWGRLRQMDQSLESATEYAELVSSEMEE